MNFGVEHLCTVMKIRGEALEILFSLSSRLQVVAEGGGGDGNKCYRLAFLSHAPPFFLKISMVMFKRLCCVFIVNKSLSICVLNQDFPGSTVPRAYKAGKNIGSTPHRVHSLSE